MPRDTSGAGRSEQAIRKTTTAISIILANHRKRWDCKAMGTKVSKTHTGSPRTPASRERGGKEKRRRALSAPKAGGAKRKRTILSGAKRIRASRRSAGPEPRFCADAMLARLLAILWQPVPKGRQRKARELKRVRQDAPCPPSRRILCIRQQLQRKEE